MARYVNIQVVHDVSAEKLFLRDLVAAGAVTDLTGALWVSMAETDNSLNSTYTPPSLSSLTVSLHGVLHTVARWTNPTQRGTDL